MKHWIISLIFSLFLFLSLSLVSAVQINMNSNFSQGETLIAQVSGNFINGLQQQNVLLYNGHVRVSFIPYIQEFGSQYYIYGQLAGKPAGNYSLVLTGISYLQAGQVNNSDVTQNFTITNSSADFSVNPGFVETENNFSVSIENLAANSISVSYFLENSLQNQSSIIQLNSGQTNSVSFSVNSSGQDQLLYAVLETNNTEYEIPVYVPATQSQSFGIKIQPSAVNVPITVNSGTTGYIYVYNLGQSLTNVSLSESPTLLNYVLIPNGTLIIQGNSSIQIQVNITSGNETGVVKGQVTASSPNSTSSMSIVLNISDSYIPPSSNSFSPFQTCSELQGQLCSANQTCSGQTQAAEDGLCCIGTCQQQGNSSGTILIWVIVAIVILLIVLLLIKRYRKAKRPLNLLSIAQNRK